MKKVKFKTWIPVKYMGDHTTVVAGTGRWSDEYNRNGSFIDWGIDYEHFDEGFGMFTVALVMLEDRTVEKVAPEHLKFTE